MGVQGRPLVTPDGLPLDQVGRMTVDEWQELVTQMDAISPEDAEKSSGDCFNASFLPKVSEAESNEVDSASSGNATSVLLLNV